jgi:hypothetical protein
MPGKDVPQTLLIGDTGFYEHDQSRTILRPVCSAIAIKWRRKFFEN